MKQKGGFGIVYQDVTRNKNIPAAAKGLYAYLSSFCGVSEECYPSVETITKEMCMGKDTFYRHINVLVAAGVVEKHQTISDNGKFGRTIYRLTHKVEIHDFPITQNEDTDVPDTVHKETKNNIPNNNNIKNNKKSSKRFTPPTKTEVKEYCQEQNYDVDPEQFIDFYESKDWMIGKNKMKDWKAAVRTWAKRDKNKGQQAAKKNSFNNFPQRQYDYNDLEKQLLNQ